MIEMTDIPAPEELVTVRQAAEMLGVATQTVHYYINREPEKLPTWLQGGLIKLRRADVEAYDRRRREIVRRS